MKAKAEKRALKLVSGRAQALYTRIKEGAWYRTYDERLPKAMKELEKVGLVKVNLRVAVIQSAYVPHNAKPFKYETWKEKQRL